jgi:hypothetical protein
MSGIIWAVREALQIISLILCRFSEILISLDFLFLFIKEKEKKLILTAYLNPKFVKQRSYTNYADHKKHYHTRQQG